MLNCSKKLLGRIAAALFATAVLSFAAPGDPVTVRLLSSVPSPQPVGTPIGLLPKAENLAFAMYVFRYSVSVDGGPYHIVRDFSQQPSFTWRPALHEQAARIKVTVRNNATKATNDAELTFQVTSRIQNSRPRVTPTANSLVALFSAPPCPEGKQFRVAFHRDDDTVISHTPPEPCRGAVSSNAYVAGMRADTTYQMRAETVQGDSLEPGPWLPFHTGMLNGVFPPISVPVPRSDQAKVSEPVLIYSAVGLWAPMATDLDGTVIWSLGSTGFLTRVLPGGRFLLQADGDNSVNDMKRLQVLREMDLAGNVLRETNIGRIAEQLESRGIHSDCKKGGKECVPGFHHDAIQLPNGHFLVLTGLERMMPAGTQGSKAPVDVLGDLIVDLDENLQVSWLWNSFDHMDLKRASLGDEKCKEGPGDDGCTPVFLASEANGWLHSNSLNYVPGSGDLIVSMPEQNWVLRIDYHDGKGTGKVVWRLGEGGDFTAKSDDPHPWFSYQHDAGYEPANSNLLTLLDDGHERKKKDPKANNRGQVWKLDEASHTATLVYNADLGVYSLAVGSAQLLKSGGYTYEAGLIGPPAVYSRAVETSPDGKVVYAQQAEGVLTYRSYRVADMYSAPIK